MPQMYRTEQQVRQRWRTAAQHVRQRPGRFRGSELRDGSPKVILPLTRQKIPTVPYSELGRWLVEALVLGDGEGSNELVFKRRVAYACSKATASREAFHPIEWDAELFAGAREGEIVLSTYGVYETRLDKFMADEEGPECIIPARRRKVSRQPR